MDEEDLIYNYNGQVVGTISETENGLINNELEKPFVWYTILLSIEPEGWFTTGIASSENFDLLIESNGYDNRDEPEYINIDTSNNYNNKFGETSYLYERLTGNEFIGVILRHTFYGDRLEIDSVNSEINFEVSLTIDPSD